LRRILMQARLDYGTPTLVECEIRDPSHSLARMRRPAIVAYDVAGIPRAYARVRTSMQGFTLKLPQQHIGTPPAMRVDLLHDVMEPNVPLASTVVPIGRSKVRIYVPPFPGSARPRNIHWANYGVSTPDGNNIRDPREINAIYRELYRHEIAAADADVPRFTKNEQSTQSDNIRLIRSGGGPWSALRDRLGYMLVRGSAALRSRSS